MDTLQLPEPETELCWAAGEAGPAQPPTSPVTHQMHDLAMAAQALVPFHRWAH